MTSFDRMRAASRRPAIHALEPPAKAEDASAPEKLEEKGIPLIAQPEPTLPVAGIPLSCIPKSPPRIRVASIAQDGHSFGEQAFYDALWRNSTPYGEGRIITIGYHQMSNISGLTINNCKANINSLIEKLAVSEAGPATHTHGRTYIVHPYGVILQKRKDAGMTHYIKTKGVAFVDPATGAKITARSRNKTGTPERGIPVSCDSEVGGTPLSDVKGIPLSGDLPYIRNSDRKEGASPGCGQCGGTGETMIRKVVRGVGTAVRTACSCRK